MSQPTRRVPPAKTGVRAPLGELELAVMRYIWSCDHQGCQGADVQRTLQEERPIALTTVLTTLERLYHKGILSRQRVESRAYRYSAALSEEQLQNRIVGSVLGDLVARFPRAIVCYLMEQGLYTDMEGRAESEILAELANRVEALTRRQEAERQDIPIASSLDEQEEASR